MRFMASYLLSGAGMAALVSVASPAYAQAAPDGGSPAPAATPAADAGSTASASAANGIGDIVVTAQRTSSLASKTPIALSAISGDSLRAAGITNPTKLADSVPNLEINRNNGGLQITIRGVTSTDNTEKGDPSAAFLLDGVYIARPQVQEVSFYDISRVEVLRGPQGTLYGRNTTAGLIDVISNRPTDHFEAAGNFSYGNYSTIQGDAMVNVPISEGLAVRAAGSYDRRDSYIGNSAGDRFSANPFKNNASGRLSVLAKPTDTIDILIRADYSSIRGNANYLNNVLGTQYYATGAPGTNAFYNPTYIGGTASTKALLDRGYDQVISPFSHDHTWGVMGELNWDLGPLKMTYLGSYRDYKRNEQSTDYIGIPAPLIANADYHQNSQELRFASTGTGPLKFQFGGYYFRERSNQYAYLLNIIPNVPYFGFISTPTTSQSYAGFAQATYAILPRLRLTGGIRYSHDDKSRYGYEVFQQQETYNPATDSRSRDAARTISHKLTWRAGVDFDVDTRSLLYGVVSTGYKAGGFNDGCLAGTVSRGVACNQPTAPQQLFFKPETLTSYEIGYKTRFADNAVRLNASAFYYDYSNLQVSTVTTFQGVQELTTQNAAKASVKGVELESTLLPSPRNRFDVSFTYLDAHYRNYFPLGIGVAPDFAGKSLDRSPKVVVTAGYTYTLPLAGGSSLAANVHTRLSDSYVVSSFTTAQQFRQPSATRTDATLTYTAPSDRWYVEGFVQNIENNIFVTGAAIAGSDVLITPSDPRTFGVRLGFKMK